jgi:hypothetical protein
VFARALFKHGNKGGSGVVAQTLRRLLYRLPAGRVDSHRVHHLTNFWMPGDRQLQVLLRLLRSSSNSTCTRRFIAGLASSALPRSAITRISSRTSGEIFSVQQKSGIGAAWGSINKKQTCASGVARLLCGTCPGTHTAYCGGTIHIAFSTSQVSAP